MQLARWRRRGELLFLVVYLALHAKEAVLGRREWWSHVDATSSFAASVRVGTGSANACPGSGRRWTTGSRTFKEKSVCKEVRSKARFPPRLLRLACLPTHFSVNVRAACDAPCPQWVDTPIFCSKQRFCLVAEKRDGIFTCLLLKY